MPQRAATIASLLAALLALGGCGSGGDNSAQDFAGEKAQVADVIEELEKAGSRGEAGKICSDILARALRDEIATTGSDCENEIKRAIEDADDFQLTVKSVSVSGLKATARVEGKEDDKSVLRTFELVKESGRWRASSFGTAQ